jgi:hypothetical protein
MVVNTLDQNVGGLSRFSTDIRVSFPQAQKEMILIVIVPSSAG